MDKNFIMIFKISQLSRCKKFLIEIRGRKLKIL